MVTGSVKLRSCEFDGRTDAIKFSAEFDGVYGRGLMPLGRLAIVIGKPVEHDKAVREFKKAVRDGFINLQAYRAPWTPWERRGRSPGGLPRAKADRLAALFQIPRQA